MEEKKQVISKIMKVYNKSKNNPSEYEAKAAVLKVQEMLAKYNLQMRDILVEEKNEIKSISYGVKNRWWHGKLANIIADNFRCKIYILEGHNKKSLVFVGMETDIDICLGTFEYIKKAINYNCNAHISGRRLRKKENIKLAKESFIEGFLIGLSYALEEQKENNEWGIVLAVPKEVQEFYDKINFVDSITWKRKNEKKADPKSFREGYITGKNLNINLEKVLVT